MITYTLTVENAGNTTLTSVALSDPLPGISIGALSDAGGDGVDVLAAGAVETATATYALTQADIDAGVVDNLATVDGTDPNGDPVTDSDPHSEPVPQTPSVSIVKDFDGAEQEFVIAGGPGSSFTLIVTNIGNVTLSDVDVYDDVDPRLTVTGVSATGGADADSDGDPQTVQWLISTMAPGQTVTITADFFVASDVSEANGAGGLNDLPSVLNEATVSATPPLGGDTGDLDSDTIDILVEIELSITKTFYRIDDKDTASSGDDEVVFDGQIEQGTIGSFELVVTNAGPSDAVDVSVTDDVNDTLTVRAVSSTAPDCSASSDQEIDCTFNIAAGGSETVTVVYEAAEFLNPSAGTIFGTTSGDEFQFFFVDGYILEGSSETGDLRLTDPDGNPVPLPPYDGTKNDFVFHPPTGDPAFTLHLSCSDAYIDGWGQTGGPTEGVDDNWRIASYSILRYNGSTTPFKGCGDVVVPWDVPNTAFADGTDSNSPPESELVSASASVTIIRQLKVEIRNDPVTKGKKLDVLLNNTGEDPLTIMKIEIAWPNSNGDLTEVVVGRNTIYDTPKSTSPALITGPWLGTAGDRTFDPGQAQKLGFFFGNKTASGGYTVTVTLEGGLTTEVVTVTKP